MAPLRLSDTEKAATLSAISAYPQKQPARYPYLARHRPTKEENEPAEPDVSQENADFFAAGVLPVFLIGAVLASPLLGLFLPPIGSNLAWSAFDSSAGVSAGMSGLEKVYKGQKLHGNTEETIFSTLDLTTGFGLIAGQAMSSTSFALNLIGIGAPLFLGPAASVAFAACMVSSASKAIYHTVRAYQKTDPCYLLADRLAKLEEIQRRIDNAYTNRTGYWPPASTRFLRTEVKALYAVLHEKASKDSALQEKLNDVKTKYHSTLRYMVLNEKPSAEETILYSLMMDKQEKKFQQYRLSAVNWSMAAIVMSAAATGVILAAVGIACPPLGIAAGFAAIGVGIMKGYEFYQQHVAPAKAHKQKTELVKSEVLTELSSKGSINAGNKYTKAQTPRVNKIAHDALLRAAISNHTKTKDTENKQDYDHQKLARMLSKKHQEKLITDYCQHSPADSALTAHSFATSL